MRDKNLRPDRARTDDLDVPTYDSKNTPTAYERAGRAAPQEIPAGDPRSQVADGTTAFPAQGTGRTAETTTYRDEDFAPTTVAPASTATAVDENLLDDQLEEEARLAEPRDARRGTIDLGLLIARLLLGVWLVLEAIGTFFQLGGSQGLAGLETEYAQYPWAELLSIIVPTLQLAAGVFLIFGLLTPVAAAVATVATGFVALHELAGSGTGFNVFAWPETVWLSLILFGLSLALQFTGPGFYSLDFGRSWARRPLVSSWIFIVAALAALGLLWWFGTAINPFA